jgi:hypothetical protein
MDQHDAVESKFAEEHRAAKESMAAERYVLDEMEPAERDAFEEHFFDCVECSNDVRDESKIGAGVRTGAYVVTPATHYTRWAVAAGLVLAAGLAYQLMPPKPSRQHLGPAPSAATSTTLTEQVIDLELTRAGETVHPIRGDQPVVLFFTIPPDHPKPAYVCELHDAAGATIGAPQPVTSEQVSDPIRMPLAPGVLRSGRYNVVIRGSDRQRIAEYPFTVDVR